jgi:hypothetical protein
MTVIILIIITISKGLQSDTGLNNHVSTQWFQSVYSQLYYFDPHIL